MQLREGKSTAPDTQLEKGGGAPRRGWSNCNDPTLTLGKGFPSSGLPFSHL